MSNAHPPHIRSTLNFSDPRFRGFRQPHQLTPPPFNHKNVPGEPGGGSTSVVIHNGRLLDPPATLETHGFQLVNAPVPVGLDLLHPDAGKLGFYEYVREVVQRATRCSSTATPRRHEYRNGHGHVKPGHRMAIKPTPNGSSGTYGMGIHSDMSNTVEMGWRPREGRQERHFMVVKLWRSADMKNNIETTPLALCDMSSVAPEDMIDNDGQDSGDIRMYRKVVAMGVCHNPSQRWYYFPHMTPDEAILFKQYDTRAEDKNLRAVFHSAVEDPTTREDAPPRYTIECMATALFGPEDVVDKQARVKRFVAQINSTYPDGTKSTWFDGPIEGYKPPRAAAIKARL